MSPLTHPAPGAAHRAPLRVALIGHGAIGRVIARELLFHVGEPFRRDLLEESGRNLRTLFILSVARLVVAIGEMVIVEDAMRETMTAFDVERSQERSIVHHRIAILRK